MGESIYSSVDSCNSTHTRVSQELLGGVMKTFLDGVILGVLQGERRSVKVWREVEQLVVVAAMGRGLLFQGVDLCGLSC